jgi:uncharacterized protein YqgQ
MSYMIEKFNNGEVHRQGDVVGWLFDTGEFRPLMDDAVQELYDANLIDKQVMLATNSARDKYVEKALAELAKEQQSLTPEQKAEMSAAFGPGETVFNMLTGKWYITE